MNDTQRAILEIVRNDPNLTIQQINDALGMSGTGHTFYHIHKLKKAGLLKDGPRWVVVDTIG